jgi:DNA transformation protein
MAKLNPFIVFLLEQMQLLGPVVARSMFGGHGLFLDGIMFALVVDNTLYLKANIENERDFNNWAWKHLAIPERVSR